MEHRPARSPAMAGSTRHRSSRLPSRSCSSPRAARRSSSASSPGAISRTTAMASFVELPDRSKRTGELEPQAQRHPPRCRVLQQGTVQRRAALVAGLRCPPPRFFRRRGAGRKTGKEKILEEVGTPAPVAGPLHQRPRADRWPCWTDRRPGRNPQDLRGGGRVHFGRGVLRRQGVHRVVQAR